MSTALGRIVADFTTSLAASISVGTTTATLQSATDDDGVALPAGTYYFAIDGDNSQKEFIKCTLSGTALTAISTITRQGVVTSGVARAHRVGASVTLTDFAQLKLLSDLLTGATDLDATDPLKYDATATISDSNHLATKAYVDGVAIAGAPDASTTVKCITRMSVAPASATIPIAVGDNDPRVPTADENNALATGDTPSATNTYITQKMFQRNAERYAASAAGTDTYAITLSPVPAAYVTGMVVYFKADVGNTGAATINVNALGAKTIKKFNDQDLETGDIEAGQVVTLIYDGTNFQMQSPTASTPQVVKFVASDTLQTSADTERSNNTTTFVKVKELRVHRAGTIRVKYDLKHDTGGSGALGNIYKNGTVVGTERTTSSTSYVNYSEDLSVAAGDLIQLYLKTSGAGTSLARNFRIHYTDTIITTPSEVVTD